MKGEPPVLTVGTEVSAKYKGAFCEAKVKKVIRNVRVQISLKSGGASQTITEDCIRGILAVGTDVSVKVPESRDWLDATITKIKDYSQYTVVFDDGDINSLRRSALCLKSGRHFAEGETLDQLPLTHPEHFGTPVQPNSARRGRRTEPDAEDSEDDAEDDDDEPDASSSSNSNNGNSQYGKQMPKVGEVICILLGEKKRQKDNWIPGLVVAPTAQDTCKIKVASECLVRSFQDGRYYTVPKKEMQPFTRETGARADTNTLRAAVEKAFLYLDKDELPPHWDRDVLFGRDMVSDRDSSDDDASDDESREQKDHFVAQLIKFMDESGTPINKAPMIGNIDLDLYRLFKIVKNLGGFNRVNNHSQWKTVYDQMGLPVSNGSAGVQQLKAAYKKHLQTFEDFNRKLGCTFVPPRTARNRHSSARSLVRVTEKSRVYLPGTMKQRNPRETRGRKPKAKATLSPNDPGPSTSTNIPSISGEQQTASSGDVFTAPTPVKGETSPPSFKQPAKKRGRKKASGKKKVSRATVARPEKKFVEPAPSPQPSTSGTKASTPSVSDTKSERDVGSDDSDWEFVDEVPKIKKTSRRRSSNASGLDVILKPEVPAKDVVAEDKLPSQVQDSSASAKQQPEVQESAGEPSSAPVASTSSDIVDDVEVGHRVRVLFTAGTSPGNKKRKSNVDSKNPPQDYEAKVLAGRVADGRQEYLVHYTGWNPRWDEWVARSQIILNLTKPFPGQQDYVPSPRGNRGRRRGRGGKAGAASSREKSDGETSQQRGKPSASKKVPEREDGGAPASSSTSVSAATRSRSGTPSSIVSSSSRGSSMQPRTRSPSVSLSPSISAGSSASYDPLLSGGSADGWRIRAQKRRGGSVGSGSSSGPRKRICPPSGHAGAADKVKDSEKSKPTAVGDSSSSEDEEDDDDDEDSDEEDEEEDGESSGSEAESEEDDRESRASSSKAISAKKPSAAAEVRKAPVVAEVKKPSVVAEVKKPSVVAEVKKPSVVPEVKKPSVVPEVKKSTTAVAEVKKSTTAVAEVKKLLVVAEVKKPSAAAKIESVDVVKQSPQGVVKIVGNSQPSTSVAAAKLMPSPASKAAEKTKQKTEELEKTSVRKPKTPKPTATVQAGSKTPEHPTIAESFVMLKRTTAVPSLPPSPSPSVPVVAASAPAASPPPTNPVPAAQSNKAESPSKVQKPAKAAKKRKSDAIDSKSDSAPEDVAAAAEKVSSLKAFREQRSPPAKMDKPSPSPSRSKQSSSGEDVDIYEFQDADEFQQPMEMKFNVGPRRWGSGSAKPPTPVASPTSAPVVAPLVAPTVAPLVIPPVAPPMSPTVAPLVTPTVAPPVTPSVSSTPSSPVPLPSPAPTTPVSPLAQVPVPTPAPISVPTRAPTPTQVQMMSPVAAAPPKHVVPAAAKPRTPPPATPPSTPYAMAFPPVAAAVNLSPPPAPVRAPSPAPVSQVVPQVPPPPPPPRLVPRPALSPISPPPRTPLMQPILTAPLVAMDLSKPAPMEPTDLSRTAGTMILHVSDHRSDPHDQKSMLVASPMSSPPQTEPLPLRREAVVDSPRSSPRSATPLVVRTPPPLPSPTSSSMSIGGPLPSLPRSNLVMPPRLSPISPPTPMQLPPSSGCNIPPMGPMLMPTGSVPLSLAMSIAPMLMPQPPRSLPSPMFGHLPPQPPMQIPMSMPLSLSMPPVAPPPSVTSSISLASLSILMSDRMPMPPQPPAAHMRLPHYDPPSRPPIMPIVPAPPYGLSPTQPPPPGPMHMSMANMGMPMGPIPCSVAASMPMSMGMPIPMDIDRPLALDTPRHMREDSRSCGWTIEAARASPGVPSHMPHQFNMMEAVPKRYQHPISRPEVTKMSPVHRVERPLELPRAMVEQTRVTEPPPRVVERPQVSPVHIQIPTSVPYAAVQAPAAAAKPVKTPAMAVARKPKTAWAHMQQASSTAVELPSPSPPTAVASVPCSSSASMSASASSPGSVGSPSTSSSASSSPSPFPTVSSVVEPLLTEAARRSPKPRTGPSFRATPIPKSSEPVSQSTHHTGRKWKSEAVARETAKGKLKEQEEARPRIVHQPTPEPAPAPRTPHADDAAAARRQDAPTVDTSASQPSTSSASAPGSGSGSRGHAFLCLETIPVSPPSSPVNETKEEAEEEEKVEKPVRQPIKLKMKRMEEETGSAGSTSGAGQKLKESGVNSGEGHGSHLRTEDAGGESGIARPSGSNPACHPPTLNASAAVELPQVAPTMSTLTPVHVAGPQGGTASRRRGRKRRGGASGAAAAGGRVRKNSGKKSDLDVSVANAEDGGEDGEVDLRRVLVGHEHLLEPVDPTWDEDQIDTELTRRLQEAKTVYHGLKAEVASIDRRRRRFLKKRGERGDQS